ncbi:hypothetical protein [Leifsonia sp. TF02-11]|uniref:hypothetical protein n=1 Tax=Leifsonia sp. TF02-11 TaxID=2815212 RepID=UPI001AA14822|nr:hypothetical protein [Leifsonia sp. TF02-11]MBO1737320.1 hypothetical protein [Leifsonia sp. TF02-11]
MRMHTRTERKRRARWGAAAVAIAATAAAVIPATSAQAVVPSSWITEQVNFITSKQLPSGAIVGANSLVMPYFANVAAIGLIDANTATSRAAALKWMKWYLAHLNAASTNVPAYSVFDYDYNATTGALTPTGDFDSVDSYASTTLNLALKAYQSGDASLRSYVSSNILTYEAIANLLTYSGTIGVRIASGPDAGLTLAKPSYPVAYTMDNAEVYSGLVDFAALEHTLGRTSQSTYYQSWATTTKNAIVSKLWNSTNNSWDWAYGTPSNTTTFYADGVAQLWPTLYGVVTPTSAKATAGWTQFTTSFPTWYNSVPDNYSWTSVARVAQLMGDSAHATTYVTNLRTRFLSGGWTYPTTCGVTPCGEWYDNEAGWFIEVGLH